MSPFSLNDYCKGLSFPGTWHNCKGTQGSYEKKGILENTVSRVLEKVPILGQQIHQVRDSSCSICAKQALQRCPLEVLKLTRNGTEHKVSYEEIHQVLQPNPHRFTGLMKNIVSAMHEQTRIDMERAKEKELKGKAGALEKAKDLGDSVLETLKKLLHK